jgi:hypothetical protein
MSPKYCTRGADVEAREYGEGVAGVGVDGVRPGARCEEAKAHHESR